MSHSNYYLKKGDKSVGPLAFDRLASLREQGKIQADALVAESAKGPWMTWDKLEASLAPVVAEELNAFGGLDLGSMLPPANTASPAMWIQDPNSFVRNQKASAAKEPATVETEDASFVKRFFFPWIGENYSNRYGNLERYIAIFKFANRVGFTICTVLFVLLLIGFLVSLIFLGGTTLIDGNMEVLPVFLLTFAGAILIFFALFAVLHLSYIASMAMVDFLRLMIDLEKNTRKSR